MIAWTEEDVNFITEKIVFPCFEVYTKELAKIDDKSHKIYMKMADSITDKIAERIRKCDYDYVRDRKFFMAFMCDRFGIPRNVMQMTYDSYCDEFDKLNKHLLDNKETSDE